MECEFRDLARVRKVLFVAPAGSRAIPLHQHGPYNDNLLLGALEHNAAGTGILTRMSSSKECGLTVYIQCVEPSDFC